MTLNAIRKVCFDDSSNKLISKRNLNWIKINHNELYDVITSSFPSYDRISVIYAFLKKGIQHENDIPMCATCGVQKVIYSRSKKEIIDYCSNKCSIKSDEVQEKTKKTCIERYGKRFNVSNKSSYDIGEHYLHNHLKNLDDVYDESVMRKLADIGDWKIIANHFNLTQNSHSSTYKFMRKHGYEIRQTIKSKPESELIEYISTLGFDFITKYRQLIKPYELDIYFPNEKLAIEFDGLFWHSSGSVESDAEYRNKHVNKTNMCESLGVSLLHIFENEWNDPVKKDIWKSIIRHKLRLNEKIYAKKCIRRKIDVSIANKFCEDNHLQGSAQASFAYGLYHKDNLVMVATYGKSRYSNDDFELIRMCTLKNNCVVGGASKLLKVSELCGASCISYGNRRWCSKLNNVYDVVGDYDHISEPCYWYVKHYNVYHRSLYMKHKLVNKLDIFDQNLTEVQNMYNNGFRRIWDCGNLVYKLKT